MLLSEPGPASRSEFPLSRSNAVDELLCKNIDMCNHANHPVRKIDPS